MDKLLKVPEGGLTVQFINQLVNAICAELDKVVKGYDDIKRKIVYALLADQHVLIESVPGLAKTLLVETLQQTLFGSVAERIQFTPDLLPQDIVGFQRYDELTRTMLTETGPILGDIVDVNGVPTGTVNILLADEINRTPPKTQSALLSPMQERKAKIAKRMYRLATPFLVIATQNPIENEGTYPLPEAQLDRFAIKTVLPYPSEQDELQIAADNKLRQRDAHLNAKPVTEVATVVAARQFISQNTYMSPALMAYMVKLIRTTRPQTEQFKTAASTDAGRSLIANVKWGMSPRSMNTFLSMCQVRAAAEGRDYVLPDDVQSLAFEVMRHRIILTDDAIIDEVPADEVVKTILACVPINDDVELYKRR